MQQTLSQKDQALGKLEQSLRLMEEASFDGTFLWKITNVTRRCHESACGRTISLFSPGNTSWAQRPGQGGRPHMVQETNSEKSGFWDTVPSPFRPVGHLLWPDAGPIGPGHKWCSDLWISVTHSSGLCCLNNPFLIPVGQSHLTNRNKNRFPLHVATTWTRKSL